MRKRKNIALVLILALALGLSMTITAFATDDEISKYETASVIINAERTSNTSAVSVCTANLFRDATSATGTVTLQEKKNGSWVTATGVSPTKQTKTVYNRSYVSMDSDWNLIKGKVYRLKFVCVDTTNGLTFTDTTYSNSF